MNPIYNTGRVRIGLCYIPRPMPIQGDAVTLQAALLEPKTLQPLTLLMRVLGAVWAWL